MLKNTKIPIRTCVGCQNKKLKRELVRIIRTPEGNYEIDTTGKKPGRGAYLCYNIKCLDVALREKRLNRSFKKDFPVNITNKLRRFLEEYTLKNLAK